MVRKGWSVAIVLVSFLSAGPSLANGDLCTSSAFRDAFEAGLTAADSPIVSPRLMEFGETAIPCLEAILKSGGGNLGLAACRENARGCRDWALVVMGKIGTARAKGDLLRFLRQGKDPVLRVTAATMLARDLRVAEARPILQDLLRSENAYLRANAVLSLGWIGNRDDFDAMLEATLGLPVNQVTTGVRGLEILGDSRAIEPLEKLAATTSEGSTRAEIERTVSRLRAKTAANVH